MSSWAVYVIDEDEGYKEYDESFSDHKDALVRRDKLNAEILDEDPESTLRAVAVEEP